MSASLSTLAPFLRLGRSLARPDPEEVLILPPTGGGSLGDQAMIEVTVTEITHCGKRPVLVDEIAVPYRIREPARILALPAGGGAKARALSGALLRTGRVAFIGADVINDKYHGTRRRLDLLALAAMAGIPASIQGFSLAEQSGPISSAQLRGLPASVTAHLRDPLSLSRYEALTGRPGVLVVDAALLLLPQARAAAAKEALARIALWKSEGADVLAVNAGGPTISAVPGGAEEGIAAHLRLLQGWLAGGTRRRLLLLPHDMKSKPHGDFDYLREICELLTKQGFGERLHLMMPPFDAWDVKTVAGAVDRALTGRMHFAIACLGAGTPALGVAYLGKFDGLMSHFGIQGMLVSPQDLLNTPDMLARLNKFEAEEGQIRAAIVAALPKASALARRNFTWLQTDAGVS